MHNDSYLSHKVHFKDTNSHSIIHPTSCHPELTFKGVIYSQIRRWACLTSEHSDFISTCKDIFPIWRLRNYTKTLLRHTKQKVIHDLNLHNWTHASKPCHNCHFKRHYFACNTIFINNFHFAIFGNLTCDLRNIIYLIFCNKCHLFYVGETKNFHQRIKNNLSAINNRCDLPVS